MRSIKALAAAAVVGLVAACSGGGLTGPSGATHQDGTWNPQQYAGCNHARADVNGDGQPDVFMIGCKQQETIQINVSFDENGKPTAINYSAGGVEALPAFESRADVEKWVAEKHGVAVEALTPALQGIVDSIIDLIGGL